MAIKYDARKEAYQIIHKYIDGTSYFLPLNTYFPLPLINGTIEGNTQTEMGCIWRVESALRFHRYPY